MRFIGLDLGTSFIKGAVLDLDALEVSHIQRSPFPEPIAGLPPLWCEIDAHAIVAATRTVLDSLLAQAPDCSGIVLCTQMQGLVLTDENGQPLSRYISWRDERALMPHPSGAGSYYDLLMQRVTPAERQRMGSELRPGLAVCMLFWLAECGQLPAADAIPSDLADFVVSNLCAEEPSIEPTNASAHGCFDLETGDWYWPFIERLGLARLRWPRVRRTGEVVGRLRWGGRTIPIYTPLGDQPCSLAGALLQPGELSINIATGSQVSLLRPRLEYGNHQTRPFFDGQYLNLITHIPAGRSLSLLVSLLSELATAQGVHLEDPWGYIARAASEAGETDLRVNLAFFASAFGNRGEIANIHEDNLSVGHLFRAAFESMAENYSACALRLSPSQDWERVVFSGGLAQRIAVLRERICARLGAEYRLCPTSEDALLGLLVLALFFSGRTASVSAALRLLAQKMA